MEVLPDVHLLKIPIENNPLGYINAYLIKTGQGCLLIDTGWNTEQAFSALTDQLHEAGADYSDIRWIVITHVHPDHYGLVGRVRKLTNATLIVHEIENALLDSRYVHIETVLSQMEAWLALNGVPARELPEMQQAVVSMVDLVDMVVPDQLAHGGEHIQAGDHDLELIWTPGHSPGHLCLYERSRKLLFAGDHVLQKITPNVSMNFQSDHNPLVDYMQSLRQIRSLDVDMVLPAHGKPFQNFVERLDEIEVHHEDRLKEMLSQFADGPLTAYQTARATPWFTAWDRLPAFSQRMAVTETVSHLELLTARGRLNKSMRDGIVIYAVE